MTPGQRPPPDTVGEAIAEIVRYALKHPAAKDAIEGIHRWWLPKGGEHWASTEIEAALESLAARGWLETRRLAGRRIWAIRRDRLLEMARWTKDRDERHG